MKHIVFCTPGFAPRIGGVEKHVTAVVGELASLGYQVTVLTSSPGGSKKLYPEIPHVTVVRLNGDAHSKKDVWLWVLSQWRLFALSDVVHVHDVAWWVLPVLPLMCTKFFITFHGWEGKYPIPILHKLQRRFFALCARGTMHIGAYIQEFYGDRPTHVLYGGIAREKRVAVHKTHVHSLVFVGRLAADTDVPLYIEYFKRLKEEVPTATLTWVGDGPLRKTCAEYGEVTGFVDNPELYMQRASIVCAASYLSCLEAIAEGKKVLALYSHPLKERYLKSFPFADQCIIDSHECVTVEEVVKLLKSGVVMTRAEEVQLQNRLQNFTWKAVTESYLRLWHFQP